MAKPKRVNLGELRYPAQHAAHPCGGDEQHQSCTVWTFAKFELDYLYDLLIDLKSGHAARQRSSITRGAPEWPLPTELEVSDCFHKTFVQDCALHQATKRLSHPYRRKYSYAYVIVVRNAMYNLIEQMIDEGISPDPMTPLHGLVSAFEPHSANTLSKTPEQYNRDMQIAVEIAKELNHKKHLDLKPETRRISNLIKETPLAHDDWDQFLWSDFLDSVFTHSARFTIEVTPTALGPNNPSPCQKIGVPVIPDTQILRRIQRQTARTASQNIARAYFSDAFIDEFLSTHHDLNDQANEQ